MIVVAAGHLARRPAIRRHNENVVMCRLQESATIPTVLRGIDDLDRVRPFRPFRLRTRLREGFCLRGHRHGKGEPAAIRRPRQTGWFALQICNQRCQAGVHPADENTGAGVGGLDVSYSRAVSGPTRRRRAFRSGDQGAVLAAIQFNGPDIGTGIVLHDVVAATRVNDVRTVRRDSRVVRVFKFENVLGLEWFDVVGKCCGRNSDWQQSQHDVFDHC